MNTHDLPFDRFAIVEAAYIYAHWLPSEQGDEILQRLDRLRFKPGLSVERAAHAAHSHELSRCDHQNTRDRVAAHLRHWRTLVYCQGCGFHREASEMGKARIICAPPDPENGPSPDDLDSWEESYCRECESALEGV